MMDRIQWQRFAEALKSRLFNPSSREFLVFAFFLLVSSGFWLIQTLNDTYDMELQVPVELSGVPADIVVTDPIPSPLRVVVRDKGTNLMRYYRRSGRSPLSVPFDGKVKGDGSGHVIIAASELQKLLSAYLLSSTAVVSAHPESVDYFYCRGVRKRVPVKLDGHIESNPLYYISDVRCVPDSVTVWAPASVLDTIYSAQAEVTGVSGLTHNDSRAVKLSHIRGVKFVPDEVQVVASVDMYTEKSVIVPITGLNFPGDKSLITFPATAKITFRIGTKQYKTITSDDFVVAVTYEELLQNPSSSFPLRVRSVPEGVSQVRISPASVDYLIEQNDE